MVLGRRVLKMSQKGKTIVIIGTLDTKSEEALYLKERIERRIELAQRASVFITDTVANAILRSYSAAVNDPKNELVHLYEIRDALSQHFGGESAATTALQISSAQWSRLGQLSNNEPLTQGRHRGKQLGVLRDATNAELTEARDIARAMIESYLAYLHADKK